MSKKEREAYQKFVDNSIYCVLKDVSHPTLIRVFYIYLNNGIVFTTIAIGEEAAFKGKTTLECKPFLSYDGSYHTNWKDKDSKYFEDFGVENYDPLTDERNRGVLFGWDLLTIEEPELSALILEYIKDLDENNPKTILKNRSDVKVIWKEDSWWKEEK